MAVKRRVVWLDDETWERLGIGAQGASTNPSRLLASLVEHHVPPPARQEPWERFVDVRHYGLSEKERQAEMDRAIAVETHEAGCQCALHDRKPEPVRPVDLRGRPFPPEVEAETRRQLVARSPALLPVPRTPVHVQGARTSIASVMGSLSETPTPIQDGIPERTFAVPKKQR